MSPSVVERDPPVSPFRVPNVTRTVKNGGFAVTQLRLVFCVKSDSFSLGLQCGRVLMCLSKHGLDPDLRPHVGHEEYPRRETRGP